MLMAEKRDPEVLALARILRLLAALPDRARMRVIHYLIERFDGVVMNDPWSGGEKEESNHERRGTAEDPAG